MALLILKKKRCMQPIFLATTSVKLYTFVKILTDFDEFKSNAECTKVSDYVYSHSLIET